MDMVLGLMFVMLIVILVLCVMMRMLILGAQVAKIHAENAIRQKNQSLNFLRMSAR